MWMIFAFGSAIFAGLTSILSKCGIKDTDSNVATALRTGIVLIFSWIMVFIAGSQNTILEISAKTFVFLILSGVATGGSWLCYFKALQMGDVNKVAPIDKSSTVLSMLLAWMLLGESLNVIKGTAICLIGVGTYLMIQKKEGIRKKEKSNAWFLYAVGSAVFASLTSILGKVGIENIDSSLGTAIRTIVVLIMAWIIVWVSKKQSSIKTISKRSWFFIILSGVATGGSWLCYYRALQTGPASIVVPIDKLSILVTIAFSYVIFHEKLSKKAALGLLFIVIGTLSLLV